MQNQGRPSSPDISDEDRAYLDARQNPHQIANRITRGTQRLGYYTVVCFILNRVIGTGIFLSPGTVFIGTQSVGISLLFWIFGAINAIAVSYLYIEFGLNIPRYDKAPVPRNGGELNYLNYLIKRPVFLATCLFGITFILLGSTAGNAISFADNILPSMPGRNAAVVGIAVGAVTFSCLIHGTWRRGGILLNNFIASIKVLIICIFPVLAVCALAGVKHSNTQDLTCMTNATNCLTNSKNAITSDFTMAITHPFDDTRPSWYGWPNAFLSVIFAYGGFNQANYVLGEIDRPRQVFPKAVKTAVALVVVLYITVNISYMIVLTKDQLTSLTEAGTVAPDGSVALVAFANFIRCDKARQLFAAFTAIASLGNIIVMTFTAARVKQEIAKEGILPFAKFFGESLPKDELNLRSEPIPVGALLLHWSITVLLILATSPKDQSSSYRLLTALLSYAVEAFFSIVLGIGMLYLRFTRTSSGGRWRDKSSSNHVISIISAVITIVANTFPIVAAWIPPVTGLSTCIADKLSTYQWYVIATVGWSVLVCSVIYWLVFRFVLPRFGNRRGMVFVVEREPFLHSEHGYYVQYHEIVTFSWVAERRSPVAEYQLVERPPLT
ncbi:hypothetical protein Egran_03858 [Elaphomyces granulatus]|uniref:Amino acid permease/ SLC12A domain-containing protein n=1 Tax=Elaphomyces granulatus TaxID=519963 RepID=A0A232LW45_9EURO|nr:hypothetical protein Egran_03858 [Elaphomyces granulatus]